MIFLGLPDRTFPIDPKAYGNLKFSIILDSKISVTGSPGPSTTNFYAFKSFKTNSTYLLTLRSFPELNINTPVEQPSIRLSNGHIQFPGKKSDPLITFYAGSGDRFSRAGGLRDFRSGLFNHLMSPLLDRQFKMVDGKWVSRQSNENMNSSMVILGDELIGGFNCTKISHVFSTQYGLLVMDSRETIWSRKSDNTTQRIEWEIRQVGKDEMFNINKLKVTAWRNR